MCAIAMYSEGSTFVTYNLGAGPLLQALENDIFILMSQQSDIGCRLTWAGGRAPAFLPPSCRGRLGRWVGCAFPVRSVSVLVLLQAPFVNLK